MKPTDTDRLLETRKLSFIERMQSAFSFLTLGVKAAVPYVRSFLTLIVGTISPYCRPHVWFEAKQDASSQTQIDKNGYTHFNAEMLEDFITRGTQASDKFSKIAEDLWGKMKTLREQIFDYEKRFREEVEPEYDAAKGKMEELIRNCKGHLHKNRLAYWVLLALFAVFDFPTQVAAFETEAYAGWQTWTICAGIAVLTAALAHVEGSVINQKEMPARLQAVFIALLMTSLFAGIAILRLNSFEQSNILSGLEVKLPPEVAAAVYFVINIVIFTAATAYSVQIHRPAEEQCRREKRAAAKRFRAAREQYEQLKKIINGKKAILNDLKSRFHALPKNGERVGKGLRSIFRKKHQIYLKTFERTLNRHLSRNGEPLIDLSVIYDENSPDSRIRVEIDMPEQSEVEESIPSYAYSKTRQLGSPREAVHS